MALNAKEKPKRVLIRGSPGVAFCLYRKYGSIFIEYRGDTKEDEGTILTSCYGGKSTASLNIYLDDGLDVRHASQHGWDLIVLVASPQVRRYQEYERKPHSLDMNWAMPRWTIDELASAQGRDAQFINQTLPRRFNLFGGIVRYCLMNTRL